MTKIFTIDSSTHRELSRFPRKLSIWERLGLVLTAECIVIVRPNCVIVRYA